MPAPHANPTTFLHWLDNQGHYLLRLGRQTRRFIFHLPWLLVWLVRQAFLFVAQAFRTLHSGCLLILSQHRARRQDPRRPRFYLIDPSYEDDVGHYRGVSVALARECAARGWTYFHLTGPLDRRAPAGRLRFFHHPGRLPIRQFDYETELDRVRYVRRATRRALRRLSRQLRLLFALDRALFHDGQSLFFFYTGDLLFLWSLLNGGRLGPRQHLALFQFTLPTAFDSPLGRNRFQRHARLLAHRLASSDSAARIHLCSDSPPLQRWLAPTLGRWIVPAHPPLLEPADLDPWPTSADLAERPHPCGYFGYLTPKHGWSIVHQLLRDRAGQNTRWLLALNPKRCEPPDLEAARRAAQLAGATLRLGFMSVDQYAAALDLCSAILLPYASGQYAMISSGKLIDALTHACFPVVPANTWLAEIVQTIGYGLVVSENDWPLVPARLAALNLPALWALHQARVREFVSQFTASHLLTELSRLTFAPPSGPSA